MGEYRDRLLSVLDDPGSVVVQVKGIGMDGHWAFHGSETPIDASADIIRVPMGEANRHQQMIDWPEYFRRIEEIPEHAVTCTVELLLKADVIVDVVPQAEKEYAVLACYGDSTVSPAVPSSGPFSSGLCSPSSPPSPDRSADSSPSDPPSWSPSWSPTGLRGKT